MWKFLAVVLFFFLANSDYNGYKIINVIVENRGQYNYLLRLAQEEKIDILASIDRDFEILLIPPYVHEVLATFRRRHLEYRVTDDDPMKEITEEAERLAGKEGEYDYEDFNNLNDIYTELDRLAAICIPGFQCSIDSIGLTIESRQIRRLKITRGHRRSRRKVVWLEATAHAREWLATATFMKIAHYLVHNYTTDKDAAFLLDNFDWHLLPVINPDGYVYSWTPENRLHRKNKKITEGSDCIGVDLNRNADYAWGAKGSSANPCSEVYHGSSPVSEPETRAVVDAVLALKPSLIHFISLHAYGQMWLTPYGNTQANNSTCYKDPDYPESLRVANAAADAIEKVYNTTWIRGETCANLYPASGLMIDWVKAYAGVKYSVVSEVRGKHFISLPNEIILSFNEIWAGLVAAQRAIFQV